MLYVILLCAFEKYREALDRSVSIPNRSESGSPTGSIRTIRTMTSTHSAQSTNSGSRSTTFMPPIDTIPDLSDMYSLSSHSSSGTGARSGLSRRPSAGGAGARAADDASVANNTLLYPGDPRVIAPSRSSSLRRTSSMTDLDEEFDSALRRARESRPGLGFGLSLVGTHATGGLVGDGSPVTVSSGPRLGRDVTITPPPSSGRRSERSSSVSDDAFFSTGMQSSTENTSSYYSLGDTPTTPRRAETGTGWGTGTDVTDEVLFGITSGTGTQIVPSTLSYRGPSSASLLGDSHSGSGSGTITTGTLMPPSGGLSRSRAMTRRSRGGSGSDISYSSHPSEESSDKENPGSGRESGSYSETGYSYGYTQTRSYTQTEGLSTLEEGYTTTGYGSGTVSRTQTPYPTSSSERDDQAEEEQADESGRTPTSTVYETAHSPSMASMSDLPNIPSEYDTADVCSTTYETARKCDTESIAETAEVCPTEESEDGFVTAAVCKTESERSSEGFVTCEVCKSETSTEYETAVCRCARKPPSEEAASEPAQPTPVTMPSPLPEPQPRMPSPLPIERRDEAIETSPIPEVSPLPVIVPVPIVVEPEHEPEPQPIPQPQPSPQPSSLSSLQPITPEEIPLPPSAPGSVYSSSLLSSPRSLSDIDLGPSITRSIPSDSLLDVPSSLPAPSPIGPPLSVPSTPLLSSITESSVTPDEQIPESERTPTSARARSTRTPSSISVRESLWAPETDLSYESSMLRASPSVQSVAVLEGPDQSFDTSFLRPTEPAESLGSAMQAYDRLSTIPESESVSISSTSIPSGIPSSSISAPSIPSMPSSSSSSLTPTPTESAQPPTPSISVSFPTTSVPSVESLEQSMESLETVVSPRSATVTVTRTPSSVSTVSSLRPGWDAVSEAD